MRDKTKKGLVIAGLTVICVLLAAGIYLRLYREDTSGNEVRQNTEEKKKEDDTELHIAKSLTTQPEPSKAPKATEVPQTARDNQDIPEPTVSVVSKEGTEPVEDEKPTEQEKEAEPTIIQEIQPEPEKIQTPMPTGKPELAEETDLSDQSKVPTYKEEPKISDTSKDKESNEGSDKPKTGDTKDGYMYIEGFGWIPDEGGGGSGTAADDMYENGNKIGIMD